MCILLWLLKDSLFLKIFPHTSQVTGVSECNKMCLFKLSILITMPQMLHTPLLVCNFLWLNILNLLLNSLLHSLHSYTLVFSCVSFFICGAMSGSLVLFSDVSSRYSSGELSYSIGLLISTSPSILIYCSVSAVSFFKYSSWNLSVNVLLLWIISFRKLNRLFTLFMHSSQIFVG